MTGFLTNILNGINGFVNNYGWAIVLFTIFIRLLLLPLDIKNRQGMRKMQKIQPELNKLQKKYANDKVKLTVIRDSKKQDIDVTLAERKDS